MARPAGPSDRVRSRRIQAYPLHAAGQCVSTVQVTEGELLALLVARRALEQYRGTPYHRQLEIAFDKLAGGLKDRIRSHRADELRSVSFRNIGLGKADLAVVQCAQRAVLRQVEVEFEYRKPGTKCQPAARPALPSFPPGESLVSGGLRRRSRCAANVCPAAHRERRCEEEPFCPPETSHRRILRQCLGILGGEGNTRW